MDAQAMDAKSMDAQAMNAQAMNAQAMNAQLLALGETVGSLLKERKETVAVAESSTGGLIAATLLAVPGASAYFLGGAVVYTRLARQLLMDMSNESMRGIRSASEPYALLLAQRSQQRFSASWGLSETGATGPTGNPYGDPAGHSCLAVAGTTERVITLRTGNSDRLQNMIAFACASLTLFAQVLGE
jgi:nicotinamide-nucleotide amidase